MKRFLFVSGAAVLVLFLLVSAWLDANNSGMSGAIDLRNRITGARLMSDGIDPYTYKWTYLDSNLYLDPYDNPKLPVSKTTSSPAMLELSLPWATLPYRSGQYMWLAAQWLFLLGTVWFWWRLCRTNWQRTLIAITLVAFTYMDGWRLGAERGQSYVVLAFFLTLWLAFSLRQGKGWSFLAGFAAGALATLRPPCAIVLPMLAWRRRDQMLGMASGLLVGMALPMFFIGNIWGDYGSAMQEQSWLYQRDLDSVAPGKVVYPSEIESIPLDALAHYLPLSYADSSVHKLLKWLGDEPFSATLVFLAGAIPFALWCWFVARRASTPRLLLGIAVWAYLLDFFIPAYRGTYNDVMALPFLFIGVLVAPRFWPGIITAALALAAGLDVYLETEDNMFTIDCPSILFALSAVLWLFARTSDSSLALDTMAAPRQNRKC